MLPLREVTPANRRARTYKRIAQSIAEIGVVEPLVVYAQPEKDGKYLLLDGGLRRAALPPTAFWLAMTRPSPTTRGLIPWHPFKSI
jgi:hypothetical protein